MRVRFTLLGGALLYLDIGGEPDDDEELVPFGFTGKCEALEISLDRDPLTREEDE